MGSRQQGHRRRKLTLVAGDSGLLCQRTMKLDLAHAQPMGTLIVEGAHRPFHALACALRPASIKIRSAR